jgi:ATP-dependent Clp protease protease subunit
MITDFEKFAMSKGISTNKIDGYTKHNFNNGIIEPYILEERTLNCAPMSVFSRLMYDKIIFLGSEINEDVANIINAQLLYLNSITDKDEDIKMFINSPGGSCIDGLAIYDVMNFIDPDVSTYCMGMCASMGSILVSSGAKGKRYILPNGSVMIHQVSSGMQGVSKDLEIELEQTLRCKKDLYDILSKNTGKSYEQIEKDCDRNFWLIGKEAVDYGLADKVLSKAEQ